MVAFFQSDIIKLPYSLCSQGDKLYWSQILGRNHQTQGSRAVQQNLSNQQTWCQDCLQSLWWSSTWNHLEKMVKKVSKNFYLCDLQFFKPNFTQICSLLNHICADTPWIGLSMSSVFASLGMKLAQIWVARNEQWRYLYPVLNMNCIVSCTNTETFLTFWLMK